MADKLFFDLLKKGEEFIPNRSENLKNKERKKLVKNITCVIDEIGSLAKLANNDQPTTSTKSNNELKYSRIKDNRKFKKEIDFYKEDDYESAREDDDDESISDEPDKSEGVFTRFYNYVKEPDNLNQIIEYTRTAITIISAGVAIYSLVSKKSTPRIGGGRRHRRLRNNIPDITKPLDILKL